MSTPLLTVAPPRASGALQADRIDALKGAACTLIVWHHLAAYGPMADAVQLAVPRVIDWLYDYARTAVQVFLVIGGFLSAIAMTRRLHAGRTPCVAHAIADIVRHIKQRFFRLAPAYWVALLLTVAVSAAVRPWFDHDFVPDAPTWQQVAAHVLLMHEVLGYDALSAGIWYIAIDLQLYALVTVICAVAQRAATSLLTAQRVAMGLTALLAGLSLFLFNRHSSLDITGLYFFGAYGLGMLAFWAPQLPHRGERQLWVALLVVMAAFALWVDFRWRIALALLVALALIGSQHRPHRAPSFAPLRLVGPLVAALRAPLVWLGKRSYSIFLIHFAVCVLFNAMLAQRFAGHVVANSVGMLAAFGVSVIAGALLYRWVEVRVRRKSVAETPAEPFAA